MVRRTAEDLRAGGLEGRRTWEPEDLGAGWFGGPVGLEVLNIKQKYKAREV